jgi:hypothetical protein
LTSGFAKMAQNPPPAFGHPLNEGDNLNRRRLDAGSCLCNEIPAIIPLRKGVPEDSFVPLSEGVAEGRGRLSPEAWVGTFQIVWNLACFTISASRNPSLHTF